jgi:16S rRNA (adenine1518-N6/adenine1519-N6)-dimethyltransferase
MVQKEVAKRIVAQDGKESILSISVKAYGEPKYIKTIARGSFYPMPNVDSAVLKIDNISKKSFGKQNEKRFFEIVKAGFGHKRKLLKKNLLDVCADATTLDKAFANCKIDPKTRAEDIKVGDWLCLAQNL